MVTRLNQMKTNPTRDVIIGGVYQKKDNKREFLVVKGFTAYDSEGKYLGTEDYPIYHALVTYTSAIKNPNGETVFIKRPNLRLAVDYIDRNFYFDGVDLVE